MSNEEIWLREVRKFCLDSAELWLKAKNIDRAESFLAVVKLIDQLEGKRK